MSTKQSTKIPKSQAKTAYGVLSEVLALILEEPKRYDQRATLIKESDGVIDRQFPACGTIGCVAGWVATLKRFRGYGVCGFAGRTLGLENDAQRSELFNAGAAGAARSQTKAHAVAGAKHIRKFQKKYRAQLLAKKV